MNEWISVEDKLPDYGTYVWKNMVPYPRTTKGKDMKITVSDDGSILISEVFSGAYLETREGNRIGFCMRDNTVEMNILPKAGGSQWVRIDMEDLTVHQLGSEGTGSGKTETVCLNGG